MAFVIIIHHITMKVLLKNNNAQFYSIFKWKMNSSFKYCIFVNSAIFLQFIFVHSKLFPLEVILIVSPHLEHFFDGRSTPNKSNLKFHKVEIKVNQAQENQAQENQAQENHSF